MDAVRPVAPSAARQTGTATAQGADAGVVPPSAGTLRGRAEALLAGQESRSWFAELSSEKRKAIRDLHTLRPWINLVSLLFVGCWIGAAFLMVSFPYWPVRIAGTFVIGASIHALAILMHEGIHGSFFRRPALDRSAAFLFGAPAFFSATAYRVPHGLHHRFNRGPRDPDEFSNVSKNPRLVAASFYVWALIGMPVYVVQVYVGALRQGTRRERAQILLEMLLLAAMYAGAIGIAVSAGRVDLLVQCWLLPACVAAAFGNVRGWAEHTMTVKGHALTQSRTVTSNWFVSAWMCNLNYHLEHHLFPAMPWYNLPKLHALLADEYRRAGSSIYSSYLRFLWDAVRTGVHGVAPRKALAR